MCSQDVMKMALYICGLPPLNQTLVYTQEKNITPIPTKGHPTKYLTSTLQAVEVIKTGTV